MPENQSETRGIQNAQVRHAQRAERRLTSSRIYDETANRQNRRGNSKKSHKHARAHREYREQQEATSLAGAFKDLLHETGVSYDENDAKLLLKEKPVEPNFPFIMLSIAIFKDVIDAADATVVGIVITTVITFVIALVLFFWMLGKLSGGWWKKGMIRWLWTRGALALAIELTPFGKIIPATTILVLMAHYREKKIVIFLNSALEGLRRKGVGR